MQVETDDMILFWQADSIYSNWYEPASVTINFRMKPITFKHSEGAFIAYKAVLFGQGLSDVEYISTLGPKRAKEYGREYILNFNQEYWEEHKERCMYNAVMNKFHTNPGLRQAILATGEKMFVEASPYDRVWGIGLKPDDPKALDPRNWRGDNLLGKVLMDVRTKLRKIDAK